MTRNLNGAKQRRPKQGGIIESLHQVVCHLPNSRRRSRARQWIDGKAPGGVRDHRLNLRMPSRHR
jgi:hypothetical protein